MAPLADVVAPVKPVDDELALGKLRNLGVQVRPQQGKVREVAHVIVEHKLRERLGVEERAQKVQHLGRALRPVWEGGNNGD